MRRFTLVVAGAAALVVAGAALAQDTQGFRSGAQAVIVAPLQADLAPGAGNVQLAVGPDRTMYTLNLGAGVRAFDATGKALTAGPIRRGSWIRATGTIGSDPRSLQITNVEVIGQGPEAEASAFYRRGFPTGYVSLVGGSREIFPRPAGELMTVEPTILVGRVTSDADRAARRLKVQAGANEWTLQLADNAPVLNLTGGSGTLNDIAAGSWVRAEGWQTDNLELRAVQLRAVGADDAKYRASEFFRPGYEMGYVTRVTADRLAARAAQIAGTVSRIDRDNGYFVVKSDDGKEHTVFVEATRFRTRGDATAGFGALKVGDKVEVSGRIISTGTGGP